ncbi:MAG TPA: hypothetical protein VIY90_18760 [Steroidobacteraceae bacterium]
MNAVAAGVAAICHLGHLDTCEPHMMLHGSNHRTGQRVRSAMQLRAWRRIVTEPASRLPRSDLTHFGFPGVRVVRILAPSGGGRTVNPAFMPQKGALVAFFLRTLMESFNFSVALTACCGRMHISHQGRDIAAALFAVPAL